MDNPFAPDLVVEEIGGGVVEVTLNRPQTYNAADADLHAALVGVWDHVGAQAAARAVVLTGAGPAFSAGGDMAHIVEMWTDTELRRTDLAGADRLVHAMTDCPLPIVAAVNGPAVGLGCTLAALSDIVLISDRAYLADPHVSVGLTAGDGGAAVWPLLASVHKVKEYLLTGDRIPARVAVEIGLANRVVDHDRLLEEARTLAGRLARQPAHALRTTKKAVNMHVSRAAVDVLRYALGQEYASFDDDEHRAAVQAFLDRTR